MVVKRGKKRWRALRYILYEQATEAAVVDNVVKVYVYVLAHDTRGILRTSPSVAD